MNGELTAQATNAAIDKGVRQFQGVLSGDDLSHAHKLLSLMLPPHGATVVDAGCGIGETARLMADLRPDLRFVLVNADRHQLDLAPRKFKRLLADYCAMPLPDASADVVMFCYALCDDERAELALQEARRVLKPGGVLFMHEPVNVGGGNVALWSAMCSHLRTPAEIGALAGDAGFALDWSGALCGADQFEVLTGREAADQIWRGVASAVFRLVRRCEVTDAFSRHERVALQFSGGRDSTATLYLLRNFWPRMTVYHVDAGDQFPETRAVVARARAEVEAAGGRFEVIRTDVEASRHEFGLPSDLVPADHTPLGRAVAGDALPIVGRYECCARNIMLPMHERMRADGNTLLVRGQRDSDFATPPLRSGQESGGFEVLYPIQAWTGEQVEAYLRGQGLPIADFYPEGVLRASDCMTCTAWWDDGRAQYLRRFHPKQHQVFIARATQVRDAIDRQRAWLTKEMEA
ncbi:hypothetical protein CCO03_16855 [Comamonas serinivorans]|uniref:Methyltransferase type 11 domain-containing protein n=1 Tax=Comamonas serinivorans TaxID=1082851 RepID=A0A1Y0ER30_9BURK|nr:methyltransferase domain-containing protein [Comamonas serinivorans]ARU06117.1 hypothetical protein CCO03_16855 [Comamonas serinivorans]